MSTRSLSTEVQGKYFSLVKSVLCIELVWDKLRELLECLSLFKNNLELGLYLGSNTRLNKTQPWWLGGRALV